MSDTITTATSVQGQRWHMNSEEVAADVARIDAGGEEATELHDAAALAIASWWQAPGGRGRTFAQLASTGKVDLTELLDAIASEYDEATRQGGSAARELDLLATWALNHPSLTS